MVRFGLFRESVNALIDYIFIILYRLKYPHKREQLYPSLSSLMRIKIYYIWLGILYFLKNNMLKLLDMIPVNLSLKILYLLIDAKRRIIRLCKGLTRQQP